METIEQENGTIHVLEQDETNEEYAKSQYYRGIIETLLFTRGDFISAEEIRQLCPEIPSFSLERVLNRLIEEYEHYGGALRLIKIKYKDNYYYKMALHPSLYSESAIKRFNAGDELTPSELRLLSLIAYYQPIEREDLIELQGKSCLRIIKRLIAKGLIQTAPARRAVINELDEEVEFETVVYRTTPLFAHQLGIEDDPEEIRRLMEQYIQ